MKKFLSIMLSIAMCLCLAVPAMAASEETTENSEMALVYSPEFPNAYIIQNQTTSGKTRASTTQTVSATVFVEEEYGLDENGNPVTTSSRLLSEGEVLAIGLGQYRTEKSAKYRRV